MASASISTVVAGNSSNNNASSVGTAIRENDSKYSITINKDIFKIIKTDTDPDFSNFIECQILPGTGNLICHRKIEEKNYVGGVHIDPKGLYELFNNLVDKQKRLISEGGRRRTKRRKHTTKKTRRRHH
jgi:hypothetical protein